MPVIAEYAGAQAVANVAAVELVIDTHSKRHSYLQLADQILAAIESGELAPRQPIPSLKQLMDQTGLAMGTVQKAVKWLEAHSYVYTVTGRGTFVTPRNTEP